MGQTLTAEQNREEYIRMMGSELGQLCFDLENELSWIHLKWQQVRELFGKNEARVDLLNRSAPLFFYLLEQTLFGDVLLHLARLTDSPRSMGHDNLTVCRLPGLVQDPTLKVEVRALLDSTMERCAFAREWRNRWLAHIDLLTLREQHPTPLPSASRQSVEDALGSVRDLLNRLNMHYRDTEVAYDLFPELGGADLLVHYLKLGLRAETELRPRRRAGLTGKPPPTDG